STPAVPDAGPDLDLCNISAVSMSGSTPSAGSGTWSLNSGPNIPVIADSTDSATAVSSLIQGTYVFRWSVVNGPCSAITDDVQVIIHDLPSSSNAGTDQLTCNSSAVTLGGNNPLIGTGTWSQVSGPNLAVIDSVNKPGAVASGLIYGVYSFAWTINNGVCTATADTVDITVFNLPTPANAGADQSLCDD